MERELESESDAAVLRQRTVEKAAKQRLESSIRRRLVPKTGRRTQPHPTCNRKPIDVPSVDKLLEDISRHRQNREREIASERTQQQLQNRLMWKHYLRQ